MFNPITDPVHQISDEQKDWDDHNLPNEVGLAQVRLRWETIQPASRGLVGLYKDIRTAVRRRKTRPGENADMAETHVNLGDGFEDLFLKGLQKCREDREREREKVRLAYEADDQEGSTFLESRFLDANLFGGRFLGQEFSSPQRRSQGSITSLDVSSIPSRFSQPSESIMGDSLMSTDGLCIEDDVPTFRHSVAHGEEATASESRYSQSRQSVPLSDSRLTRRSLYSPNQPAPRLLQPTWRRRSTIKPGESRTRPTSASKSGPTLVEALESKLGAPPSFGEAFSGMFDTEKSRRRARKRWEREVKKLEVIERMTQLCSSFDRHVLAPIPHFRLVFEANLRGKGERISASSYDEWPEDIRIQNVSRGRRFVMNITRWMGWHLGLRHQSLTAIAALRNLSRRVHPLCTLLYYPNAVNSFSDSGLMHLLEFQKKKKRLDQQSPYVVARRKLSELSADKGTLADSEKREEIKKRLREVWSARVLGDNIAPPSHHKIDSRILSPYSTREEDGEGGFSPDLTTTSLTRRLTSGDARRGSNDSTNVRSRHLSLLSTSDVDLVPRFLTKFATPQSFTTPKFGMVDNPAIIPDSIEILPQPFGGLRIDPLTLDSPRDEGRGERREEGRRDTKYQDFGDTERKNMLSPPGYSSSSPSPPPGFRLSTSGSVENEDEQTPRSEVSLTASFQSDDDLRENEFYGLLGDVGRPRLWQPRLLLMGGVIQRDRDSYGRVSEFLYDSPIYTLIVDRPRSPDEAWYDSSSSEESEPDERRDASDIRREYLKLFEGVEEVDLRDETFDEEDNIARGFPDPSTLLPTQQEGVYQLKIPSSFRPCEDETIISAEASLPVELSLPADIQEQSAMDVGSLRVGIEVSSSEDVSKDTSQAETPQRMTSFAGLQSQLSRGGDQTVDFDFSAFTAIESPSIPIVQPTGSQESIPSVEEGTEPHQKAIPQSPKGQFSDEPSERRSPPDQSASEQSPISSSLAQSDAEESRQSEGKGSPAEHGSHRRTSVFELTSVVKALGDVVEGVTSVAEATGETLKEGFRSAGEVFSQKLQPVSDTLQYAIGETWADLFGEEEESEPKVKQRKKKQKREKSNQYIFRLNSQLFQNVAESSQVPSSQAAQPFPTETEPGCSTESDRLLYEALSGIVRLDFKRASAGGGVHLRSNAGSPAPRYGAGSVIYRGKVYIFGGAGEADWKEPVLYNDTWVLSPACDRAYLGSSKLEESPGSVGYIWQEIPLKSSTRPPPCAFHLSAVHNGYMYTFISECTVGQDFVEPADWIGPVSQSPLLYYDKQRYFDSEYRRGQRLHLKPQVVDAYRKRSQRATTGVNQLWRLDLECQYPEWEEVDVTIAKGMTSMTRGGISMTFFGDRLYVYGVITSSPFVCIGVLDISIRQWLTWVRLSGAPVW